jgi:hypothetical protein
MAYVYRHIRIDKNEPFYIGIGKDNTYKRAFQSSKTKRSDFWHNIASKGYEVEILMDNLTWEQACEKEKEFISIYGRRDLGQGTLVNLTNGGDGVIELSKESIESIRKKLTGLKQSEYTKNKRKESLKNVYKNEDLRNLKKIQSSNVMSIEMRKIISDKLTGIKRGKRKPEHTLKSINSLKEYYKTNEPHNKIIFSEEKKNLIFKYYNEKMPISKIAKHFFVSRPVIYRILNLNKCN